MSIEEIVDLDRYPVGSPVFRVRCRELLMRDGALVLPGFMRSAAVDEVRREGSENADKAYADAQLHNVYLTPDDPDFPPDHVRNRKALSSKGCLTDDQISAESPLRALYDSEMFREFLCSVLEETALYPYADPLSSVNLHFARIGQELGWHFDNSSFSVTLMIEPPEAGGAFEYVPNVRDADAGQMNFAGVEAILDGRTPVETLVMDAGALVLFRGRNAMHRVAPNEGMRTRMLAVLAYNSEPGVSLSESARMTFYGRLG